ncbi:15111_t:CDS:1 [Cetraspora pellucida]|uniref:15111_t:CDS:1 n=1 Tax=Cetraspora pellucida TaxID=1433469 RepID=A0ACA9LLZ2_9GLOM|nr:15111_t:CDS:1 [Cetraspora pellucida]
MYSKKFLENSESFDKGFAFEYNILQLSMIENVVFDGYYHNQKNKRIGDGGFDFNYHYKDKYFLIQAKCYSSYSKYVYKAYKDFMIDLKEQPKEYIGIFLIGTYNKLSYVEESASGNKNQNISEKLKDETKNLSNDSGHEIIICDDYELTGIMTNNNLKDNNDNIIFSRLRLFKLTEEEEHELLLKLHSVIDGKFKYRKLLNILPSDIGLIRTRHQYKIKKEIKKIGYAGFDFVYKKRRYAIRYEIKEDLEYLKKCVNDFDISLKVFPNNIWGIFLVPDDFEIEILKYYVEKKNHIHRLYVIGIDI